jgi:hypothetical protein
VRSIVVLLLVAVTSAYLVVRSLPDGEAYAAPLVVKTQEVQSISIDGGRGLPVTQLRDAMETKIGATVDPATLERDRAAIEHALEMRGYLNATVAAPTVTYGPQGGVFVVFDVERGPLFHIRTVRLEGPGWANAGVMPIADGDDARGDRLERVRQAAEATLARHGSRLRVELAVDVDHADAMIDVRLTTR